MNLKTVGIITGATGVVAAIGMSIKKIMDNRKRKKIGNQQKKDLDDLVRQSQELTALIAKNQETAERWNVNLQENSKETLKMMETLKKEYVIDCDVDPRVYDVTIETI